MRLRHTQLIIGLLWPLWLIGQRAPESTRVPVVFKIDQGYQASSMAIELPRTALDGMDLATYGTEVGTPLAQAMLDLVAAFQTGDPEAVMERAQLQPYENAAERRSMIDGYQRGFAALWDAMQLHAEYTVGDNSTVIWSVPMPGGNRFVRSFSFGGGDTALRWVDGGNVGADVMVERLLMEVEQKRVDGEALDTLAEDYRYNQMMPGTGAQALFNGTVLRWDPFSASRPDLEVAAVYSAAYRAFRDRDMEGFASYFTPYSAEKFRKWVSALPPEELEAYYNDITQGREVRVIIDADPVFVIYYNTPDRVDYDTMVRSNGQLRLTNFYIEGFVDDLLSSRDYFIEPVIVEIAGRGEDPVDYVPVAALDPTTPPGGAGAGAVEPTPEPEPQSEGPVETPEPEDEEGDADGGLGMLLILLGLMVAVGLIIRITLKRKSNT